MKKELMIYITLLLAFVSGLFILMPAVAKQEQNTPSLPVLSKGEKAELPNNKGEDIQRIMQVIEDKEKELNRREDALKKEEGRLNMLKQSLELSLKEYTTMRDKLQKDLTANSDKNGQTQKGTGRIVQIYESMSPEEAAQRIEKMDNSMAVELLSKIKSKKAGKILGAISSEKAASLTEMIAAGNRKDAR